MLRLNEVKKMIRIKFFNFTDKLKSSILTFEEATLFTLKKFHRINCKEGLPFKVKGFPLKFIQIMVIFCTL